MTSRQGGDAGPRDAGAPAGMRLTLVTGGVRSGKSRYVVERAADLGGGEVTFIATARVHDDEMAQRVRRHREERPAGWETLEAPHDAPAAIRRARHPVLVLDCLTLLLSNATEDREDRAGFLEASRGAVDGLLQAAASRSGHLLVVTNEVGLGVVPASPVARWFRDAQGEANVRVAAAADTVTFMVSGLPWTLKGDPLD